MKKILSFTLLLSFSVSMFGFFSEAYARTAEEILLGEIQKEYCNPKPFRDERLSNIENCRSTILDNKNASYFLRGIYDGKCTYDKKVKDGNMPSRKVASCSAPLSALKAIADDNRWYVKTMCELSSANKYEETMSTQTKYYPLLYDKVKYLDAYCTPI